MFSKCQRPRRRVIAAQKSEKKYSPFSVSIYVSLPYKMTQISSNTDAALVQTSELIEMASSALCISLSSQFRNGGLIKSLAVPPEYAFPNIRPISGWEHVKLLLMTSSQILGGTRLTFSFGSIRIADHKNPVLLASQLIIKLILTRGTKEARIVGQVQCAST